MFLRTTLALTLLATPLAAGPVSFSSGWQEQRLSLFSSNSYSFGSQLSMTSDGSVSIAWTRLPRSEWGARAASWAWTVEQSVPPTDLSRKGGDDRNLSVYFVFVPEAVAASLEGVWLNAWCAAPVWIARPPMSRPRPASAWRNWRVCVRSTGSPTEACAG